MAIATVLIKGRQYTTVAGRVAEAHAAGGFSMLSSEAFALGDTGRWYVRVTITIGQEGQEAHYVGTAEVKLGARAGTADGDSPYECAETSALGRALGFAGFGSSEGIASAEEMSRVQTR